MSNGQIRPEKVTRPIQLLAAWLAGLVAIDSAFLVAAANMRSPTWGAGVLIIASILNVPLFLVSVFLLQTRFRPEMQEDTYYAKYLERRYSERDSKPTEVVDYEEQSEILARSIARELGSKETESAEPIRQILREARVEDLARRIGKNNRTLWELYLRPGLWAKVVERYRDDAGLKIEIQELRSEGLLQLPGGDIAEAELTDFGREIASVAEKLSTVWWIEARDQWDRDGRDLSVET